MKKYKKCTCKNQDGENELPNKFRGKVRFNMDDFNEIKIKKNVLKSMEEVKIINLKVDCDNSGK